MEEREEPRSEEAGPSSGAGGKKAKRFEIKRWNAVALWAWGAPKMRCGREGAVTHGGAGTMEPRGARGTSLSSFCWFWGKFLRPATRLLCSEPLSPPSLSHPAFRHRGGQLRHLPQPHHGPL